MLLGMVISDIRDFLSTCACLHYSSSLPLSLQDLHVCMLTTFTKIRTCYLHYNFLKSTFLGHFSHYHNLKLSKTVCQSSALYIATQINFPIHTKFHVTPVKLVSEKLTFPLPLVTSPMIYQPNYQHQKCLQL